MTNNTKIRLYIDMDGTIAKFYEEADCLERMYEPGFFIGLKRYQTVIEGLKMVKEKANKGVEFYVLSAINPDVMEQVESEKRDWTQKYFPIVDDCFFTRFGESKSKAIQERTGIALSKRDVLLDDYNANLTHWIEDGGTAIKMVNEINDKGTKGPLWAGYRVRYDFVPERICEEILLIIEQCIKEL